jgi:hypothetical protein
MTRDEFVKLVDDVIIHGQARWPALLAAFDAQAAEVAEWRQSATARKQAAEEWNAAWHERNKEALAAESALSAVTARVEVLERAIRQTFALSWDAGSEVLSAALADAKETKMNCDHGVPLTEPCNQPGCEGVEYPMQAKAEIARLRGALSAMTAERDRIWSEKYEAACLRTGHVATEATHKIAKLEKERDEAEARGRAKGIGEASAWLCENANGRYDQGSAGEIAYELCFALLPAAPSTKEGPGLPLPQASRPPHPAHEGSTVTIPELEAEINRLSALQQEGVHLTLYWRAEATEQRDRAILAEVERDTLKLCNKDLVHRNKSGSEQVAYMKEYIARLEKRIKEGTNA